MESCRKSSRERGEEEEEEEEEGRMRREGLLTGQLWNKDIRAMVKVKNKPTNASKSSGRCGRTACQLCHDLPVGKAKANTKGRRNKLALSLDDDWALAATSSRPGDASGSKVKLSSHALDYDLNDAYDIYAACRAIDAACGANVDHTFDIDVACHAIDVACAFDIDATCHAIDVACAVKINDIDDASDSYVDRKICLVTDDVNLACHIGDAVLNCAFDDYSCDDDHDHEKYDAHDVHHVGDTTAVKNDVKDDDKDDYYDIGKHDDLTDAWYQLANHDPARINMVCCGPSVNENDDVEYDEISDSCCGSSIDDNDDSQTWLVEGEANSLSSDWYHVAPLDKDEWYLC